MSKEVRRGWLVKEGGWFRTWLRRFFILDQGKCIIEYFVDNSDPTLAGAPKGIIELKDARLLSPKQTLEDKQKDHCIGIATTSGRTYYLVAEDAGVAREWIADINMVIKSHHLRQLPPSALKDDFTPREAKTVYTASTTGSKPQTTARGESSFQGAKGIVRREIDDVSFSPSVVSHTARFKSLRKSMSSSLQTSQLSTSSSSANLERLRTRLSKLLYNNRTRFKNKDAFEQSVVPWAKTSNCARCDKKFGFASFRKNCRLCGDLCCDTDSCLNMLNLLEMGDKVQITSPQQRPQCDQKDINVLVCVACEQLVMAASKGAQITQARDGDTELQMLYGKARKLEDNINGQLQTINEMTQLIMQGHTAGSERHLISTTQPMLQHNLSDLTNLGFKISGLKVKNASAQRARFQSNIKMAIDSFVRDCKAKMMSLEAVAS